MIYVANMSSNVKWRQLWKADPNYIETGKDSDGRFKIGTGGSINGRLEIGTGVGNTGVFKTGSDKTYKASFRVGSNKASQPFKIGSKTSVNSTCLKGYVLTNGVCKKVPVKLKLVTKSSTKSNSISR